MLAPLARLIDRTSVPDDDAAAQQGVCTGETPLAAACHIPPGAASPRNGCNGKWSQAACPRAEPPVEWNQRPREGPRGGRRALPLSLALSEESPRLRASAGAWRGGATRSGRGLDRSSGRLFAAAAAVAENGMSVFERHHYG